MPSCGVPIPEQPPVGRWIPGGELPAATGTSMQMAAMPSIGTIVTMGIDGFNPGPTEPTGLYNALTRTWKASTPTLGGLAAVPGTAGATCPSYGKFLLHHPNRIRCPRPSGPCGTPSLRLSPRYHRTGTTAATSGRSLSSTTARCSLRAAAGARPASASCGGMADEDGAL